MILSTQLLSLGQLVLFLLIVSTSWIDESNAFVPPIVAMSKAIHNPKVSFLKAKNNKGNNSPKSKGFGKIPVEEPKSIEEASADLNARRIQSQSQQQQPSQPQQQTFLTSIQGGSDAIPTIDESIPVEERTDSILREKYGLRTLEEQQREIQRTKQAAEQQKKLRQWKEMADRGEDFDLLQILPGPVLIFIDRFLKVGLSICTVLFVAAGLAITAEAGSKATNNPLPENVDAFITNVVEPNFTPGLLVLLGFSVSLGAFAALQLSSASSTYREDR
jgi:hypothetical protein